MKVWLVDDEAPARRRLARMLAELEDVKVTAELEDAIALLEALRHQQSPDLVFLDVEMPGLSGLTVAARTRLPPFVFVTAHERYAVEAFEVQALDYLLKPVRPERLKATLARARAKLALERPQASPVANTSVPRVTSHSRGMVRVFDARDIVRFWSADKYTMFVADGCEQMTEESLIGLAERLAAHGFVRVHRGELVRTDAVRALRAEDDGHEVVLSDGQVAKVSRRSLSSVRAALGLKPAP